MWAPAIAGLCAAIGAWYPVTDGDLFWHLSSAREMVATGTLLYADPFSFAPTQAWTNLHWLFQLVALGLHNLGGPLLIVAAKCLVFGLGAALCFHAFAPERGRMVTALAFGAALLEVRYLALARPTVVTLLLLAAFLLVLERAVRKRDARSVWWLIAVQIVWVNVQPLFVLGPLVAGLYAIGATLRSMGSGDAQARAQHVRLWVLTALLLFAGLVNPYGVGSYGLALHVYGRIDPITAGLFSANISENAPLMSLVATKPRLVATVVIISFVTLGLFAANARVLRLEQLGLFAGLLYLAFGAERNVMLFVFVAVPIAAHQTGLILERTVRVSSARAAIRAALVVFGSLVALGLAGCIRHWPSYPYHPFVSPFRFPEGAVEYLRDHPVPGNVFNADRFGGYLMWSLGRGQKVFMDGRFAIRTAETFREYLDAYDRPSTFNALCEKYSISHALLHTAFFPRFMPLARHIAGDPSWRIVFADGATLLAVRDSLATTPRIDPCRQDGFEAILNAGVSQWGSTRAVRAEAALHARRLTRELCQ